MKKVEATIRAHLLDAVRTALQEVQYGARTSLSASGRSPLGFCKDSSRNLFALRAQADRMSALH